MPSAVSRLRSQVRQNGSVVDEMMPNVVPSGSAKRSAGADEPGSSTGVDRRRSAREALEHLPPRDDAAGRPRVAPPTSMYSMNRTSAFTDLPVLDQVDQLVVVDALDDDGIDLEAAEDAVRRRDAGLDARRARRSG